ncbi:energy transducer TonB [Sphingomonas sp. JC676]|uniref:energy transducer TonB n=1 Tax=Sphingomonas sp. JC676 TaxID=2768065 RepID=UPI001657BA1C|nr:energy transducer TonB [Sphingomonas sp. JC676]MBC9031260.1 energy transducer TonB [Sphingomonas sp. JC676]
MAYADRNVSGSRVVAIVLVALIVAGMGYAFVTGLAYQYIKKKAEELKTFEVEEPPPPPEEVPPPPPPPDTPVPPPPTQVVTPPAIVQTVSPSPPIQTTAIIPPPPPLTPPAPPAPPAPPQPPAPPRIAKALKPKSPPQGWVTNDDYPSAALRAEQQGSTGFRLSVDASGKVTDCTITSSSGSALLDNTACSLLKRRARFSPAEDAGGNKIPAAWSSRFRWELPKN